MTPRTAWENALEEADKFASGVVGVEDPDEARELVAEDMVARGKADPVVVQALMAPKRKPPEFTLQDALEIHLEQTLNDVKGRHHRASLVRYDRVMRLAEKAGLPSTAALSGITREQIRRVRDHMLAREKQGGDGARVSPASVKKEIGMLQRVIIDGSRVLGQRVDEEVFKGLRIKGQSGTASAQL